MELKGSCHCEKVTFKVVSNTPAPVSKIVIYLRVSFTILIVYALLLVTRIFIIIIIMLNQ